jgi:2-phosphosulfolactate phosphatase
MPPLIDVALTPASLHRARTTVVIDALRATSTAVAALGAGYRRVRVVPDVETALGLRGPGRVLAGEYRYVTPAAFDHGNSPADAAVRRGDELVLATTNGTPAIVAAAQVSQTVLLCSMRNLAATVAALRDRGGDVQLVCSGSEGEVALEDVYVAGRIGAELPAPRTDAAVLADAICRRYGSPLEAFSASAAAGRLRAVGMEDDVADCARESVLELVAEVTVTGRGCSVVAAPRSARARPVSDRSQQPAEALAPAAS